MDSEHSSELEPSVSKEFIEENIDSNLDKPRHKFAPYSKHQRAKRREEVRRLHFENGIPAIKIAELMKLNRHTIESDIQILYSQMLRGIDGDKLSSYLDRTLVRLDLQRTRLMSYLQDAKDLDKKLATERQLADLDFRLAGLIERIQHNTLTFHEEVLKTVNSFAEQTGMQQRYTTYFEKVKIPISKRRAIDRILNGKEEERQA